MHKDRVREHGIHKGDSQAIAHCFFDQEWPSGAILVEIAYEPGADLWRQRRRGQFVVTIALVAEPPNVVNIKWDAIHTRMPCNYIPCHFRAGAGCSNYNDRTITIHPAVIPLLSYL